MNARTLLIVMIAVQAMLSVPAQAHGGTTFLGAKAWYGTWDSGVLNWLEKDIGSSFQANGVAFQANSDPGTGYLAGPLFGYQTDDNKWSFSFAPMVISSFSQDWKGSATAMNLSGSVTLDRRDYDLAVNYLVSKQFKVFAGYKYQDMEIDFSLTYEAGMGQVHDTYHLTSNAHIPTVGVGVVQPMGDRFTISGQLGILYSILDLKITNGAGRTEDIWPHPGLGFNVEANVNYQPLRSLIAQVGYRYQVFTIEARGPGRDNIEKSYDITQGPTLSLVYLF
jgi:hypothetical protein